MKNLPKIIKEAFYIATTGRPGPVVIDIPKNISQELSEPIKVEKNVKVHLQGYQPTILSKSFTSCETT